MKIFFLHKTRKIEKKFKKGLTFSECDSVLFNAMSHIPKIILGGTLWEIMTDVKVENAHLDGKTISYNCPLTPKGKKINVSTF